MPDNDTVPILNKGNRVAVFEFFLRFESASASKIGRFLKRRNSAESGLKVPECILREAWI